jgi:hypothetical protein
LLPVAEVNRELRAWEHTHNTIPSHPALDYLILPGVPPIFFAIQALSGDIIGSFPVMPIRYSCPNWPAKSDAHVITTGVKNAKLDQT